MKITQPYPALTFPHINEQLKEIYDLLNKRLDADNIILKHQDTLERTADDHHPQLHRITHEIGGTDVIEKIDGGSF